jgi:hypothetical protein
MKINNAIKYSSANSILAESGFSLVELLIAGAIGVIVVLAGSQLISDQVIQGRRLEAAQRFRENIGRLNYLIQVEASESSQISQLLIPAGCSGGSQSFTLVIQRPTGGYASAANNSLVQYYNGNDANGIPSIWRCGPPVERNGVLRHGATNVAGVVMGNAQIELGGQCSAINERSVSYSVVPSGTQVFGQLGGLGGCVTAHARSVFICNPAGSSPQVGDCQS